MFGIGWLIIAIARATFPIFLTYSQTKSELKAGEQYIAPYVKAANGGVRAGRLKFSKFGWYNMNVSVKLLQIYVNKIVQFYMGMVEFTLLGK